ncbi:MAG: RNA polymerase sigma factor [Acidimicrobiia bacterium]
MTTPPTDVELVGRVVSGDHGAFEAIMRQHEDRVFSVCLRITGNRDSALDATQETFLTVFSKAGQFKGDAALGTWIYRIAVNTCYDQLRKAKRRKTDPLPEYLDPIDPSAENAIDSAALRPEMQAALASLPTDFKAAIVLSDIEGMSMAEVAHALGVPPGTVKSRLFRGRRLLAEYLGAR